MHVTCGGDWNELIHASALLSVARGAEVTVPLAVVRRAVGQPPGDVGLAFDDGTLPVVRGVRPGGPAARAGVTVDDLVTAVNQRSVSPLDATRVEMLITNYGPGSHLTLSVVHSGARRDVALTTEP